MIASVADHPCTSFYNGFAPWIQFLCIVMIFFRIESSLYFLFSVSSCITTEYLWQTVTTFLAENPRVSCKFRSQCGNHCPLINLLLCGLSCFDDFSNQLPRDVRRSLFDAQWWHFSARFRCIPFQFRLQRSNNFPASNCLRMSWFFDDYGFEFRCDAVGISLTNCGNILQLNVRAFRCTSDNIVSVNVSASDCLCLGWVLRCVFWFQFRDVYRNLWRAMIMF